MKLYSLFIILFCPLLLLAQNKPLKLRTSNASKIFLDSTGRYLWHTEWTPVNSIIVLDGDNNKVTLYSTKQLNYSIFKLNNNFEDEYGYWLEFSCIDNDARRCNVRVVALKDGSYKVYIDYKFSTNVYKADQIE
jgi:hypothetical protein